jgi:conjugative transfer signal peptidase TraF
MHFRVARHARLAPIGAALILGLSVAAYTFGFRLNLSASIPPGVYRVTKDPVAKGSLVLVCLPPALSAFARSRDYVRAGSCKDGNAPVGKVVAAAAGDTVDVTASGLMVNGGQLSNTRPLGNDGRGRALPHIESGRYIVRTGQIWLASSYSTRSFDSRYFGPVPVDRIVSSVRPIVRRQSRP